MSLDDPSLIPNPDNGMVQYAGLGAIETPPGTNLAESQVSRIIATSITLMVLSTIFVALRFLARKLSKAGLWWDDWAILAAMLLAWGSCICMIAATNLGYGQHAAITPNLLLRVAALESYLKIFYAYEALYTFSIALCKFSILLFYSRIFTEGPFRIALYVMFGLVSLWLLAIGITVFAECIPVSGLWQVSEASRCIDLKHLFLGSGIPNVLLNVVIVFLPVPMIWTLDIERRHRLALSAVFGLGTFVIVVSIIRVVVLANVSLTDVTWNFVDAGIWTSVEPSIAVVSACLPILRSLWIWNRRRTQAKSTNTNQTRSRSPVPPANPKNYGFVAERKIRHDSLTSPINELSADAYKKEWAARTAVSSPTSPPAIARSEKKFDYKDDADIKLHDLPIQKPNYPSEKALGINKPLPVPKTRSFISNKKNHVAELYGS